MADLHEAFSNFSGKGFDGSGTTSPTNATVPSINIGGSPASPASPKSELLGRSLDIKKQLSHSLHGHSGGATGGGVTKPKSRRNSAYHIKPEDGFEGVRGYGKDEETEEGKEDQGIERKRRDNINEKIQELLTLIPHDFFVEKLKDGGSVAASNAPYTGAEASNTNTHINAEDLAPGAQSFEDALAMAKSTGTRDGKPNKGQILTHAVEYIQHLQNVIDENNRKEVELYLKLKTLQKGKQGSGSAPPNVPIAVEATSAEKALGEIGVGPESEQYFRNVLLDTQGTTKSED